VKFTVYRHIGRVAKCKGIPTGIHPSERGFRISFKKCFINKKYFGKGAFYLKDIRWKDCPIGDISFFDLFKINYSLGSLDKSERYHSVIKR